VVYIRPHYANHKMENFLLYFCWNGYLTVKPASCELHWLEQWTRGVVETPLPVHIRSLLLLKAKPSGACFLPEVEFIFPLQLRACKSILGALLVYAVKELCGFSDNCCPTIDNHLLNVFFLQEAALCHD
jgi:hypothetical protein